MTTLTSIEENASQLDLDLDHIRSLVWAAKTHPPVPVKTWLAARTRPTLEDIEDFEARASEYAAAWAEHCEALDLACKAINDLLGKLGVPTKWKHDTHRQRKRFVEYNLMSFIREAMNHNQPTMASGLSTTYERQELKKAEVDEALKKQSQAASEKVLRACRFCLDNGLKYLDDFTESTAIDAANSIIFDRLVEERVRLGGFIEFIGSDFCDDCAGWDMTSHRCQCGGQGVSWESEGDFEDMQIYAQSD